VGSLIYIFKVTSGKTVQTELKSTMTDKELVKRFTGIKTTYDVAISENTSMSDELIQEGIRL
jgi:hypothetical protein